MKIIKSINVCVTKSWIFDQIFIKIGRAHV
jgi:hypothetical protein